MNHDYHKLKQRKNKIGKNSTVTSVWVFLHRLNILGTKFYSSTENKLINDK